MYDKNSDYALNKRSRDSIVCKSVTGDHIHIRREDFFSDEEFEHWKAWSDADYHNAEKQAQRYSALHAHLLKDFDGCVPSAETILLNDIDMNEFRELVSEMTSTLTPTQARRIELYFARGLNEQSIAAMENTSQQAISKSIRTAIEKLKKFFESA